MAYYGYETKRVERFIPQFSEFNKHDKCDWNDEWPFTFTAAMVETCQPIFNGCESNYEVEDILKKAKVIRTGKGCMTDSESCQFFIYFKRKDGANNFFKRLNKYLLERGHELGMRTRAEAREAERKAAMNATC